MSARRRASARTSLPRTEAETRAKIGASGFGRAPFLLARRPASQPPRRAFRRSRPVDDEAGHDIGEYDEDEEAERRDRTEDRERGGERIDREACEVLRPARPQAGHEFAVVPPLGGDGRNDQVEGQRAGELQSAVNHRGKRRQVRIRDICRRERDQRQAEQQRVVRPDEARRHMTRGDPAGYGD